MRTSPRFLARITLGVAAWALVSGAPAAQAPSTAANAAVHAKQVKRLLITNAMVIPGPAVPASGPIDILLEDGLIARMGSRTAGRWPAADMVIDATGKYVMPGIEDRKSTRLNSSHGYISYAVFCLKKKKSRNAPSLNSRYKSLDTLKVN